MIIAVCSAKASPGATTIAAWLATVWPRDCMLIEADVAGGSLVARWNDTLGLSYEPGLISLAASRGPIGADMLARHSQALGERTRLVAAPPSASQTRAALVSLGDHVAASVARLSATLDAVVDCGRLDPSSPTIAFARRAATVLLVARPRLDEISTLRSHAESLCDAGVIVELVCVGARPYHPVDVAAHVGVPLAGVISADARAAEVFALQGPGARGLARSALGRSISELASALSMRAFADSDSADSLPATVAS